MSFLIQFSSKRVTKEIRKFTPEEQQKIDAVLNVLRVNPKPIEYDYGHVNRNTEIKRIKSKRLRIFYKIDEDQRRIIIGKVINRDSTLYSTDPAEWFSA
ncbi:type II toxin-antitoxin system RelE family toxin [Paenibacillus sp. GYB003]|uniref:type II toxin-antitoxin system RelE family toxin n=1 Tax=Paenibacillus sp. GYB003 TaxID=2994392 RepID=UPI002F96BE19